MHEVLSNRRNQSGQFPSPGSTDVAVVGCGLRLPGGVKSLNDLWSFLVQGGDGIRDLPEDRWIHDLYDPKPRVGRTYVRRAGYIDDIDLIDTAFIGCSPREAMQIDPQQRLLIETAVEALDNAGMPLSALSKTRTGVFVGISSNDYIQSMNDDVRRGNAYTNTGGALSIAANRISYVLDLRGPSLAIDTACSSGLAALDMARRSIEQGACNVAIVGAANALIRPEPFVGFCQATMLSPDAQCRAFDADGKGFVRAEGAVSFILKPLGAALDDNDPILGVLRGSDSNNDGRTSGLSLPSSEAQEELIRRVFSEYRISPDDVAYVEAHGTGTAAGDPVEAGAIGRAIGQRRKGDGPLMIGSIKSNIGHLEPASGLAGLAKALLCLNKRQVPQSLHFENPNPAIEFDELKIRVADTLSPLPATPGPSVVCVNSFGFGGANTHVVVAEPPARREEPTRQLERPWLMVSGRSPSALTASARRLVDHMADAGPDLSLHDVCGTLLTRRTWHPHRVAVWGDTLEEMRHSLEAVAEERECPNATSGLALSHARTAFVFTGNGPQWWGMGRQLYDASPLFRETLDSIDAAFRRVSDLALVEEMHRPEAESRMHLTEVAQPALFGLQVGLVRCLAEDGLLPDATVGHSAGELAAAYCAGLFDLETIVAVVSARSEQQGKTAGAGAMAAIGAGVEHAQQIIAPYEGIVIAGDNGPEAVSVAGPVASIDALVADMKQAGTFATKLRLNYAFHSPAMDPIEQGFRERVSEVHGQTGSIPFYSTVTGDSIDGAAMDVEHWWGNLRRPVQFRPAIARMSEDGYGVFVEIGPHPNFTGYVKAVGRTAGRSVRAVETLRRGEDEELQRRKAVASAAVAGSAFDFSGRFPVPVRPLGLPTYPWQHERYFNRPHPRPAVAAHATGHALLGRRVSLVKPLWTNDVALSRLPFIGDHVIRDTVLFPAAGFFEIAVAAGRAMGLEGAIELRSARIEKALALDPEREATVQTTTDRTDQSLVVASRPVKVAVDPEDEADAEPEAFTEHMRAVLTSRPPKTRKWDRGALQARMNKGLRTAEEHYRLTSVRGLNYGPMFQTVDWVAVGEREALVQLTRRSEVGASFTLDPTLVDGALQAMISLIDTGSDRRLFVPVQLERLIVHGSTAAHETIHAHVKARGANRFYLTADIVLATPDGSVIAELFGMQVRAVGSAADEAAIRLQHVLKPLRLLDESIPEVATRDLLPDRQQSAAALYRRSVAAHYNRDLEALCATLTAATFREVADASPFTVDSLVADGAIAGSNRRYAEAILATAISHGTVAARPDGSFVVPAPVDAKAAYTSCARRYPAYGPELLLTARIGLHHAALLKGDKKLLEVLFPRSGSPLMEQVYEQGFASLEANETIAEAVARCVERIGTRRAVRILEVGGGTGGTTAHILSAVDTSRVEYVFSDVSADFLTRAERRFGGIPTFSTTTLDLTGGADVNALGGPFDIVVAANVVHATPNVTATLSVIRGLLRDGGLLAIAELDRHGYFDFFFGLLPELWNAEDRHDRPTSALLSGEAWVRVLRRANFGDVTLWSDETGEAGAAGSVLLARKPSATGTDDRAPSDEPVGRGEGNVGRWLVLSPADDTALAAILAERIERHGGTVIRGHVADDGAVNATDGERISAEDAEASWTRLCRHLAESEPDRIVVVAPARGLDRTPRPDEAWPLAALTKAAGEVGWSGSPRLDVVTQGTITGNDVDLAGGSYWAVGRAIVNEQSNWRCRRLDVDGSDSARQQLIDHLFESEPGSGETRVVDEVCFAEDGAFTNVIETMASDVATARSDTPFAVTLKNQGSLDNLVLREIPPATEPEPGMVEIAMRSGGINFKDIILALGMLPPELLKDSEVGPLMGLEGSGVVSRVGAGVTTVKPGDRVMLMAEGCFRSTVTVPEFAAQPIPDGWSFEEAATLPVVGLTVVYALDMVASLEPGETVLVHGGAGGIGLMAIQYAKAVGAKVIATAGSEEKRDLLRLLGVDLISDSRSLHFEEEVKEFTGGEGVDVVLNSLAGEAMLASIDTLKPFGRFVEIGKRDFEANNRLNLRALENNIAYFAVDLTYLPQQKPKLFLKAWKRLSAACASGDIRPLPFRTYGLSNLSQAFRLMQGGRHIGKLVVDLDPKGVPLEPLPAPPVTFADQGVHIIAGGLGGVGLRVALWMADRGARTIALLGRSGVKTDEQATAIAKIEAAGARVVVAQVDVADGDAVRRLVADLRGTYGPIRGVMHAVLVLDDRLMMNMTREAFEKVARPKIHGGYNLHTATLGEPLDYFVAFSSLASVLGNPGQSNYVAGNAYLEQLAIARRAHGLPGVALQLGAVADAGVVERDAALKATLDKSLGGAITVADILEALDDALKDGPAVAAVVPTTGRFAGPIMKTARVEALATRIEERGDERGEKVDFEAVPPEERAALMERVLVQTLAKVMGAKEARIDPERSLSEAGLDSLMAVEFAMAIEERVGASIPTAELTKDRSLRDLATTLLVSLNIEVAESKDSEDDTEEDTMVSDSVLGDAPAEFATAPQVPVGKRNAVLLTGATGFLGTFILDELARCGPERIICLGRGEDEAHAAERVRSALRHAGLDETAALVGSGIEVWPVDLSVDGFGLSEEKRRELAGEVDLVVHNAADVNFLGGYEEMRDTNVASVRQFLDFAATGRPKAFHFVSTLRIFVRPDQLGEGDIDESVAPWQPPGEEGGYVKTKWAADALVRTAIERGLTAGIHRPSFVIGRTSDGYSNVSDLGSALAKFALDTGTLPDVEVALPVVPVDVAARRIVMFADTPGEQTGVRHITDWPALSIRDIKGVSEANGVAIELLPVDEFVDRAVGFFQKNPGHPAVWLPTFFASGAADNPMASRLAEPVLPSGEERTPDLGRRTLGRMVDWFRSRHQAAGPVANARRRAPTDQV